MARTVGLDIASCIGIATVGPTQEEDRGTTVKLPDLRGFQRLQLLADSVANILQTWESELIVIEGYAYCRNVSSFITLVEIGTVIRWRLYSLGMDWVEVPPTVLKKWTTGKGNAKKEDMLVASTSRWGFKSHSHDIVDAYALAQMGQLGRATLLDIPGVKIGHI